MKSLLPSKKRLRIPSLIQTGSWAAKKYQLVRALLSLARENGALRTRPTTPSACARKLHIMSEYDGLTEEQRVAVLQDKFPNSPYTERLRFLRACKGCVDKTIVKLQSYQDWRELHGLDQPEYQQAVAETTSDEQDWLRSCKQAILYMEHAASDASNKKKDLHNCETQKSCVLPQIVFAYSDDDGTPKTSKTGRRLLHVMPARINKKLASPETYALALSLYLDNKQDRHKLDLFFVMLDVRPGKGWSNPPAYTMMPFIRAVGHLLHENYPERLDKLFVYPLPRPAIWIWEMVKPFLDPSVVDSAHLVGGKDTVHASPPNHVLCEHVDEDLLDLMEKTRIDNFCQKLQVVVSAVTVDPIRA